MPNGPKLHHYVPQFYLDRFVNDTGKFWVWDKLADRPFQATPDGIAAETHFYRMPDLPDPLAMEKQFSRIEGSASLITEQWLHWLRDAEPLATIEVPDLNRSEVSLYLTTQYLRTVEQRKILSMIAADLNPPERFDDVMRRDLHTKMLWDDARISTLRRWFYDGIWVFARNNTAIPFVTSDNPIIFKTADNQTWIKVGMLSGDTYSVFPLSPEIVMYCYDGSYDGYANLHKFDCTLSPISLTESMVVQENTGQTFAASRFVISPKNDFAALRDFARTIGTDEYAPKDV